MDTSWVFFSLFLRFHDKWWKSETIILMLSLFSYRLYLYVISVSLSLYLLFISLSSLYLSLFISLPSLYLSLFSLSLSLFFISLSSLYLSPFSLSLSLFSLSLSLFSLYLSLFSLSSLLISLSSLYLFSLSFSGSLSLCIALPLSICQNDFYQSIENKSSFFITDFETQWTTRGKLMTKFILFCIIYLLIHSATFCTAKKRLQVYFENLSNCLLSI